MVIQNLSFFEAGFVVHGMRYLSAKEALCFCNNGAVILDIRLKTIAQFKQFDVPEVLAIPYKEIWQKIDTIPKSRQLIVADSTGLHSNKVLSVLIENGFTRVAGLAGGFVDWERNAYPVKTNIRQQLSGACMCQLKARNP